MTRELADHIISQLTAAATLDAVDQAAKDSAPSFRRLSSHERARVRAAAERRRDELRRRSDD
jgi:hypothetical protein